MIAGSRIEFDTTDIGLHVDIKDTVLLFHAPNFDLHVKLKADAASHYETVNP